MQDLSDLSSRYKRICERVADAAVKSGRNPEDVLLVAVTKYAQPEQIRKLIELGHIDFAESKVQNLVKRIAPIEEFLQRHHTLTSSKNVDVPKRVRWHMIGHLQRNKVRKVLDLVTLIHSVDTLRLAEEIQDAGVMCKVPVDILIQVNSSYEKNKFGLALPAALHMTKLIDTMSNIRVRGLMTMGPATEDEKKIRESFERCRECFDEIKKAGIGREQFNILSMGMSSDFEIAIEYGANMVRVGSAIFSNGDDDKTNQDEEISE